MLTIETADPTAPGPKALLEASHALMNELFAMGDCHYLSLEALQKDHIHFFAARDGDETLGTGALANMGDYGELKSMFTAPAARGKGVAAAILRQVEDTARELGLTSLKLETGDALTAACAMYERHGFTRCSAFGCYEDGTTSIFYEKTL